MTSTNTMKGPIEDSSQSLELSSFDGGLMSDIDLLSIPVTGCSDVSNMKFSEINAVLRRDGWTNMLNVVAATVAPDGGHSWVDAGGVQRTVIFANGNTYDVSGGALIATFTGTYTAGNRVCAFDVLNALLYSDGITIYNSQSSAFGYVNGTGIKNTGQRVYNPALGTEGPNYGSGQTLCIDPPAFQAGTSYDGCAVIGNLTYTNGNQQPSGLSWSNVNDYTSFLSTAEDAIGLADGSSINCIEPFSLSTEQIAPQSALFIGKNGRRVYAATGALGVLQEVMIRCPVGCLDGGTAKFIPMGDGGVVCFLGTDKQFWGTNGVTAVNITARRIRNELSTWISTSQAANYNQRFWAGRNYNDFQYVCNVGQGRHYCLDWDHNNWTKYNGWPDGKIIEGVDGIKEPVLFVAALVAGEAVLGQLNIGQTDNGAAISPYWQSASLRGFSGDKGENEGPINKDKLWYYCTIDYTTDIAAVQLDFTPDLGEGTVQTVIIPAPPALSTNNSGIYGTSTYDGGSVYAAGLPTSLATQRCRQMVRVPYQGTTGAKSKGIMRTPDLQVKVSTVNGTGYLRINSLTFDFVMRGSQRVKKL